MRLSLVLNVLHLSKNAHQPENIDRKKKNLCQGLHLERIRPETTKKLAGSAPQNNYNKRSGIPDLYIERKGFPKFVLLDLPDTYL